MWSRTGRGVRFQGRDDPGLGDLIGAAVLHIHRSQQENIALLRDSRGDGLHDLAIDGLLVVRNEVLVEELLNLVRGEPGQNLAHFAKQTKRKSVPLTSSRYPE